MNEYEAAVIRAARQVAELILADHPNIRDAQDVWFRPGTKELVKALDDLDNFEKWGDPIDPDHLGTWGPASVRDSFARVGIFPGQKEMTTETLHINQTGSRLKLCGETGGLGTWPSNATCMDCRKAYEASGDSERFRA